MPSREERAARTAAEVRARRFMGPKRRRGRLPRALPPRGIERDYALELSRRVRAAVAVAFAPLLDELPRLLESAAHERVRTDAGEGKRIRELVERASKSMSASLDTASVEALAEKFAARTSTYQRIQLGRQTRAALGVDVFIGDKSLRSLVETFAAENAALVRSITTEVAAKVERASIAAVQSGMLHKDLAKQLSKEFGYPEKRAKLIARDQVGKLYGQINASRQKSMGASQFRWRTVNDERVRDEHAEREGEVYDYNDPPDGELPGEPILCRCYAEPIFDFLGDE